MGQHTYTYDLADRPARYVGVKHQGRGRQGRQKRPSYCWADPYTGKRFS